MAELEVWVLVDDNGDYVASSDGELLAELYEEHVQECSAAGGLRRVKVTLTVPLPVVVELSGTVPADGKATLSVK